MDPPNAEDRQALFQAQLNKMPLDGAVDIGNNRVSFFFKCLM